MISVSIMSLCLSVFGFAQLTAAVKLVTLHSYGRKYFWVKNANPCIFQPFTVKKSSYPPLIARQDLDPAVNRKL